MSTSHKKIVIFDDDEDILSICSYILEEQGWEVHTFSDCNNIVEKVSGILPDVIMMDNWIPDSGGIVATQTLKKTDLLKDIPVIYFSANSDIQILADHAGAQTFLAKPFDLEDLEKVISTVIAA
ncbi:two-component system, cell cycle response regulator DivK [Mucilaginibacter gossypiicola]|uniref:Two-component system, cell cycle response regulator DivK n=1 Tax=Mucilaginibacter gossypiicola TaxID=551995 RepID=A0A1H8ETR8_9SPHI|nr:response regulator [Mucilaginibacter gossypiicola]SEN22766.1 two-component system, cell cycle response regulator DivK [Mucilaginibacter gossypiicola]